MHHCRSWSYLTPLTWMQFYWQHRGPHIFLIAVWIFITRAPRARLIGIVFAPVKGYERLQCHLPDFMRGHIVFLDYVVHKDCIYTSNFMKTEEPCAKSECHARLSKLLVPLRPTEMTGTASPCTTIGTAFCFQFGRFLIG